MTPRILAMHGRGLVSTLIRWQTRGPISHIAIEIEPSHIIEAWQGDGVRRKQVTDWSNVQAYKINGMTPEQGEALKVWLFTQLGKKYDYKGVFGFVTRANQKDNKRWFCSELAFAGLQHVDINLFERTEPWEVSPSLLIRSPLLIPEETFFA